jgi:hypothetical protein
MTLRVDLIIEDLADTVVARAGWHAAGARLKRRPG